MKIAIVQLDIVWEDYLANLQKAERFVKQAQGDGCELVVFPEMFTSGFSMNVEKTTEGFDKSVDKLAQLAKERGIAIIAGVSEKTDGFGRNTALFVDRSGKVHKKYVKNYPFSFVEEEKFYKPGSEQIIFDLDGVCGSLFICYDLRFGDIFRKVAKEVAIVFVIANWPESRQDHWETLLKARAIEGQFFVVGVNRIGTDGNGLIYAGGSQIVSPSGEVLIRGGHDDEYLFAEIDLAETARVRDKFPFLQDMK